MKTIGINHVTLLVKNKIETEKFFTQLLGLEKYDAGGRLWIRVGEKFLHISENSGVPTRNSFYHFAIEVDNVEDCAREIVAKGVKVFDLDENEHEILVNTEFDKPIRQFFLKDPDGNLIELIDINNQFFNPRVGI